MELVNKQKVEALFSPALTGKTTYTADEILLALQTMPTVDAIPISWIDTYCTDCSIDLRDNDAKAIKKLLEDWKKENE